MGRRASRAQARLEKKRWEASRQRELHVEQRLDSVNATLRKLSAADNAKESELRKALAAVRQRLAGLQSRLTQSQTRERRATQSAHAWQERSQLQGARLRQLQRGASPARHVAQMPATQQRAVTPPTLEAPSTPAVPEWAQ